MSWASLPSLAFILSLILCGVTALIRLHLDERKRPRHHAPVHYKRAQEALGIYDIVILVVEKLAYTHPLKRRIRHPSLARYASVSRVFQDAVESITFRSITFHAAADFSSYRFAEAFSGLRRRGVLREISITPTADSCWDKAGRETCIEGLLYDAVFLIFRELHRWEEGVQESSLGEISLAIRGCGCDPLSWVESTQDEDRIRNVPLVRSIRKMSRVHYRDKAHSFLLLRVAARTPNLRQLIAACPVTPCMSERLQRSGHRTLARLLHELRHACPKLTRLELSRTPGFNNKRLFGLEDCGVDPVCEAIRLLAEEGLERLFLSNIILSPDLFRDRRPGNQSDLDGSYGSRPTIWPSLRALFIECYAAVAVDPAHGNEVSDIFRPLAEKPYRLASEIFDPLLQDMLDVKMPMLDSSFFNLRSVERGEDFDDGDAPFLNYTRAPTTLSEPQGWWFVSQPGDWTPPEGLPVSKNNTFW